MPASGEGCLHCCFSFSLSLYTRGGVQLPFIFGYSTRIESPHIPKVKGLSEMIFKKKGKKKKKKKE